MARKPVKHTYDTMKIPEGLTEKIDEMIRDSQGDFTSRTDVIKFAVRLLYRERKKMNIK